MSRTTITGGAWHMKRPGRRQAGRQPGSKDRHARAGGHTRFFLSMSSSLSRFFRPRSVDRSVTLAAQVGPIKKRNGLGWLIDLSVECARSIDSPVLGNV